MDMDMQEDNNLLSLVDELLDFVVDDEVRELGINIGDEDLKILDTNQANFFLRRINDLEREKQKINDMCDLEINNFERRVNEFRNSKVSTLDNTINYFSGLLERYAQNELATSNKKSLKLPFGTLQFKKSPDKYEYEDEKVLKFIEENQLTGLTRVKTELSKAEIKKAISISDDKVLINGKEVEGIKVTPGETKFNVKTSS